MLQPPRLPAVLVAGPAFAAHVVSDGVLEPLNGDGICTRLFFMLYVQSTKSRYTNIIARVTFFSHREGQNLNAICIAYSAYKV